MPYARKSDLPETVRDSLPELAQEIYREAFNGAWGEYDEADERRADSSREQTAHRVAWSTVENKKSDGKWRRKDQ